MKADLRKALTWLSAVFLAAMAQAANAQETAFVYLGELVQTGAPADGVYDFLVTLYDTDIGGTPLAPDEVIVNEPISNGVFYLQLDFGVAILDAAQLWIELSVREAGQPNFTLLSPRWLIAPSRASQSTLVAGVDSVTNASFAADTISSADIAIDAMDGIRIGINSVQTSHIQDGAVSSSQFSPGSVGLNHIAFDAVGNNELALDSVGTAEIAANAVGSSELAPNSVGQAQIASGAVGNSELAPNVVTSTKLASNSVGSSELASNAVGSADVITSEVQLRVSGSCASGMAIGQVQSSGTVTCEGDSRGLYGFAGPDDLPGLYSSSGAGSVTWNLGPTNSQICWLSLVDFRDLDSTSEAGRCQVFISGGDWILEAFVTQGRDGVVYCNSLCSGLLQDP